MKKLFLFPVIVLMILLTGCNRKTDGNILKVITLNIRYENPADSFNGWPYRASIAGKFLKNEKADIIGMQEEFHHGVETDGLAFFSRHRISSSERFGALETVRADVQGTGSCDHF